MTLRSVAVIAFILAIIFFVIALVVNTTTGNPEHWAYIAGIAIAAGLALWALDPVVHNP